LPITDEAKDKEWRIILTIAKHNGYPTTEQKTKQKTATRKYRCR
jgi:hypothetical protein